MAKSIAIFDSYYSELCSNSHNLLGCVGLKKTEYCILNRRYSKEEYQSMRDKIIVHMKEAGEWGEFFPAKFSLFAYNETVAQDYFPLTEVDAIQYGFRWYHRGERDYRMSLDSAQVPETISETDNRILKETIGCISQRDPVTKQKYLNCATAFRIMEAEREFYKKMNIPIPSKCSTCRRQDRMELRNPRKLWGRTCQCMGKNSENGVYQNIVEHFHGKERCPNEFKTSYAPERPEVVYCEQCYQAEIV